MADSAAGDYSFAYNGDNSFAGRVSSNKSIDVITTRVPIVIGVTGRDTVDIKFYYTYGNSSSPEPKKSEKKTEKKHSFVYYLPTDDASNVEKTESIIVDRDTFKSEVPAKTVIASEMFDRKSFFDLKVHESDGNTKFNQEFLARCLVPGGAKQIFLTKDVYPRRDLSITENGMTQTISWDNLPKNQPGPVYAVVYNQIDGAYVLNGILDANGTATFTGFKLRPASTITICK